MSMYRVWNNECVIRFSVIYTLLNKGVSLKKVGSGFVVT